MKKFYALCVVLSAISVQAQVINFPDAQFKNALVQANQSNMIAYNAAGQQIVIDSNSNGQIEQSEVLAVHRLNLASQSIADLTGIGYFINLVELECHFNQLSSVDLSGLVNLEYVLCGMNPGLSTLNVANLPNLRQLSFQNCSVAELDLTGTTHLGTLNCNNNPLTTIDLTQQVYFEFMSAQNCQLETLLLKGAIHIDPDMGSLFNFFNFGGNPNLQFLCVSEDWISEAQDKVNSYGYTNCVVNSYCSFEPGGTFYTVQGNNKLDSNGDGCDNADAAYPNLQFSITNDIVSGIIDTPDGNYSIDLGSGSHTITPIFENPSYFTATPAAVTVSFPSQASPFQQDFCIGANGTHKDLEISIIPVTVARPGFSAQYKIICRNKGTNTLSSFASMNFDSGKLDFVSATPAQSFTGEGFLSWGFNSLEPLETIVITMTMNVHSPLDPSPVNIGDILDFSLNIGPVANDEVPADNYFDLHQVTVGSYDPNDKTCVEGNIVGPDTIGNYVHYLIRFENTGTYAAENVVVRDVINTTKFDVGSLIPLVGSHPFTTRFTQTNKVEFIFENINLPFDDANNDGYVAFKIKTKPTLAIGDTFSNSASIYFDYNFPIVTNTALTTIQLLGNPDFEFSSAFTIFPNPAQNTLNVAPRNGFEPQSASIYNSLGQLVMSVTNFEDAIDLSQLQSGNYFIRVYTDKGDATAKFIKQ
jgi:hypothetical protein